MSQQIPQIKAHEVTSCIYNFHVNALRQLSHFAFAILTKINTVFLVQLDFCRYVF
jgi:hypothetical protein